MHMVAKGNIYAYAREQVMAQHAKRIEGSSEGLALVVFSEPLSDAARNALDKSFAAIGYDSDACTFADIGGLSADDVFDVVEGIDPLVLVATDAGAAKLYSQAVRQDFPPMRTVRVFGREARAFPKLNDMLETERDKQSVWHLLKSLK